MTQDAGLDIDFDTDVDNAADAEAYARAQAEKHYQALQDQKDQEDREDHPDWRAASDARLLQDQEADTDAELAGIQGTVAAAGPDSAMEAVSGKAVPARTVALNGKNFRIAKSVGLMPMLKFSAFADMEVQDARALGAMYTMLKDVIDPPDWRAFEDHAVDSKADADDLLDVISKAVEQISGRPTKQPGPSSRGPRGISGGSTGSSSARRARGSRR